MHHTTCYRYFIRFHSARSNPPTPQSRAPDRTSGHHRHKFAGPAYSISWLTSGRPLPLPPDQYELLVAERYTTANMSGDGGQPDSGGGVRGGRGGGGSARGLLTLCEKVQTDKLQPYFFGNGQLLDLLCPNLQPLLFKEAQGQHFQIYNY